MRLIDADALIQDLTKWMKQVDQTHPQEANAIPPMEDIIVSTLMTIDEQPTIEERKKGKWLRGNKMPDYPRIPYRPWMCYCSECKSVTMQDDDRLFDYCPNCGARMER